jgi:hypothetical protein
MVKLQVGKQPCFLQDKGGKSIRLNRHEGDPFTKNSDPIKRNLVV